MPRTLPCPGHPSLTIRGVLSECNIMRRGMIWTQSSAAASRRRSRVIFTLGKIEGSSPGTSIARQLPTPNRISCFGRISRSPPEYWPVMSRSSRLFLATLVQIKSGTRPHRCPKSELPRKAHLHGKGTAIRPLWQAKEKSLKSHVRMTTPAARRRHSGIEIKQPNPTSRISRWLADLR